MPHSGMASRFMRLYSGMVPVNLRPSEEFDFANGGGEVLLIACGALAREIIELIEKNRWTAFDVACLPAKWHNTPQFIPEGVREKIRAATRALPQDLRAVRRLRHRRTARQGAGRGRGRAHRRPALLCLLFRQRGLCRQAEDEITAFYLTDYLARHFDKLSGRAWGSPSILNCCRCISATTPRSSIWPRPATPKLADEGASRGRQAGARLRVPVHRLWRAREPRCASAPEGLPGYAPAAARALQDCLAQDLVVGLVDVDGGFGERHDDGARLEPEPPRAHLKRAFKVDATEAIAQQRSHSEGGHETPRPLAVAFHVLPEGHRRAARGDISPKRLQPETRSGPKRRKVRRVAG
jgi:hypothetical protein